MGEGGNTKATAGRAGEGPARERSVAPAARFGIADDSTRPPRAGEQQTAALRQMLIGTTEPKRVLAWLRDIARRRGRLAKPQITLSGLDAMPARMP